MMRIGRVLGIALLAVVFRVVTSCGHLPTMGCGDNYLYAGHCENPDETTNPPTQPEKPEQNTLVKGKCLCVKEKPAKLRTTVCKENGISVSGINDAVHCFKYAGYDKTCTVNKAGRNLHAVDYFGETRLIGPAYVKIMPTDEQCCNETYEYLKEVCKGFKSKKLTHEEATKFLKAHDIKQWSSTGCTLRKDKKKGCTSLTDVQCRNIVGIIWLKKATKNTIVITGGTEYGHSRYYRGKEVKYSHWNGYKLDIRSNVPGQPAKFMDISEYIPKHFIYLGIRSSDRALQYTDSNGFEYNYEWRTYPLNMHWDIKYTDKACIRDSYEQPGLSGRTMCVVAAQINVRNEDCSKMKMTGSDQTRVVKKEECYTSMGENMICILKGSTGKHTAYNMHKLNLDVGKGLFGWVASDSKFLKLKPEKLKRKKRSAVYDVTCGSQKLSPNTGFTFLDDINQRAKLGEIPWHATILFNGVFMCSGFIIDDRWILTAAHCVVNRTGFSMDIYNLTIKVGGTKLYAPEKTTQIHGTQAIILHHDFKLLTSEHDLAVIQTKEVITFNDYIQPLCLSSTVDAATEPCISTGMSDEGVLMQKTTSLISYDKCSGWSGAKDRLMIGGGCGSDSIESRRADSGAMIVCKSKYSKWRVAGVTSWDTRGISNVYPLFTNVSNYLDWIYDAMGVAG